MYSSGYIFNIPEIKNIIMEYVKNEKYDKVMKELKKVNDKRTKISHKCLRKAKYFRYYSPFRLNGNTITIEDVVIIKRNNVIVSSWCEYVYKKDNKYHWCRGYTDSWFDDIDNNMKIKDINYNTPDNIYGT